MPSIAQLLLTGIRLLPPRTAPAATAALPAIARNGAHAAAGAASP
jgi:hypothetical protein